MCKYNNINIDIRKGYSTRPREVVHLAKTMIIFVNNCINKGQSRYLS